MENGVSKYWTPEAEEYYNGLLAGCRSFAQRDLIMTIRDVLKYDGRTKAGKRSMARARLRIATASDEDLAEMAILRATGAHSATREEIQKEVDELVKIRAKIREKGIRKGELQCQ